jgi:uncharacterized cysteine cluster protein YcgN (CxxCxxCC family)
MAARAFWQEKTLAQMSLPEWEALCDGCGKCCLHKLEDEDDGKVYYTAVACQLLDTDTCRCSDYPNRKARVPDCLTLTLADLHEYEWLPSTCAYRLLAEGEPLPSWHPLVSGDPDAIHRAGMSVAGKVVPEQQVAPDDLEDCIIHWII